MPEPDPTKRLRQNDPENPAWIRHEKPSKLWMQCPGCFSANLIPQPAPHTYIECDDCGEKLTVIDLRNGEHLMTDRGDLVEEARQRWEQEVGERLELGKQTRMLTYAADCIRGGFPGFAESLHELKIRLNSLFGKFGEAEPVVDKGHTCDPERPCEPNDHLCKNYLQSKKEGEANA